MYMLGYGGEALSSEIRVAPAGRLLSIVAQALHWQQYRGLLPRVDQYDLFADAAALEGAAPPLALANTHARSIKFGKRSAPLCAQFAPDGLSLATGSVDGFLELWNPKTGKMRRDLEYQANDDIMMHEAGILCLAFSLDSLLLASGSSDGKLKVWQVATGKCVSRFERAHSQGVTSVAFVRDGSKLLTSSFDETVW
jgi:WD40 repeat-containing protein SMU1